MGKLFDRVLSHEEARLLPPREGCSEREEQQRHEALLAMGYEVVWDRGRVAEMKKLGIVFARVRADGARWPMSRVSEGGYAFMAMGSDRALFEALTSALNAGEHARTGSELEQSVASLRGLLEGKKNLTADNLAAIETIARLGKASQVLDYLQNL